MNSSVVSENLFGGGVKLSLDFKFPNTDLFTPGANSATTGFFSVADNLLFWFLRAVLKLSSRTRSVLISDPTDSMLSPMMQFTSDRRPSTQLTLLCCSRAGQPSGQAMTVHSCSLGHGCSTLS